MIDDIVPLDGNAAAGPLGRFFAIDVTILTVTCGTCAGEGLLAELRLYGGDAGVVLRCRKCDAVNIRMLETDRSLNLDLSGASRISIRTPTAL